MFQALSMGKLLEKLGVERYSVVGTSYGGFMGYNMAKMLVEKVVLASSSVNMRRSDNEAFIARAKCKNIKDVMLPSSGTDHRRFSGMISTKRLNYVPDFVLDDFCQKMYSEKREEKAELLEELSIGKDTLQTFLQFNSYLFALDLSVIHLMNKHSWVEQNQVFPLKMAHDLKEMLGKKATLKVIEKTSHTPQTENSKEFNSIIFSF